jgi:ankyrin repeat protein
MMRDQNRDGNTPLHIAAQLQNAALIPYLDKSNPHLLNSDGLTPIHCALLTRNEQFFEAFLLQVKKFGKFSLSSLFESNEGNFNELPLLHFVAGLGMPKTMRLLVQNGSEFLLEFDCKRNTVLHHIARLMVCQIEKDAKLKLLQVVDEVVEAYAQATLDLTTFSATAVNALTARRYALGYLTRKVLNKAGYSVLMYAAKKDAVEYVQHLLRAVQPEQQFDQLRNMKCPLLYDVSYLTPQSWRWMTKGGVKFLTSWSAPSSNTDGSRFPQDSNIKDNGSYSDSDSDDSDNDVVFKLPAEERKFDFLGVVLNSRKSDRVKQLLEQSPMPEMLQSFIGAYQWFHMLILLTHLTFMTVFTYYSVTFLDTVNEAIEPNRFVDFVFGHKRNNGAFLVWPAMMCASHLLISILKCLHWFGYCRCSEKQLHKEPNASSRHHNTRNKKRCKRLIHDIKLYALVTVLVLVMCVIMFFYCISTAIWYVGVSNCIDTLEFPFKILAIIFTVLSMLEVLLLMKLGTFNRLLEFFTKQITALRNGPTFQ